MGQLDEADSQYRRALELEPGSAAFKAEAHLVDIVRNNLKQGRQCLKEGDARHAPNPPPGPNTLCMLAKPAQQHLCSASPKPPPLHVCGDTLIQQLSAVGYS